MAPTPTARSTRSSPQWPTSKKIGSPYPYLAAWPFHNQCEPEMLLMKTPINTYVLDAALANLTRWVRDGVAPPKGSAHFSGERRDTAGACRTRPVWQCHRWRAHTLSGCPDCHLPHDHQGRDVLSGTWTHRSRFPGRRLASAHGTPQNYATKVTQSVDRLVKDRWLTESDGKKIKAEADRGRDDREQLTCVPSTLLLIVLCSTAQTAAQGPPP